MMPAMRRMWLVVVAGVLLVGVVVAAVMLRASTSATSTVDPDVSVKCAAGADVEEQTCRAWGDAILAEGSPTTTFEAQDIVRLRLDRELFGLGETCRAEWFLGRYPDDVAWSESVACPDG